MDTIRELVAVPGIYAIQNMINKKIYVGKSVDVGSRLYGHLRDLKKKCHPNKHLQASFNKHGESVFIVSLLERVEKENAQEREMYWIEKLEAQRNGYNFTIGGEGIPGHVHTEETKMKMSSTAIGHSVSEETRAKISAAQKGRKHIFSAEHRANLSKAMTGKIRPPAVVAAIIAAHKGKPLSPEHRNKISAALKGRKASEETRMRSAAAARKQWETRSREVSEEQRAKLSAAGKKAWVKRKQNATITFT